MIIRFFKSALLALSPSQLLQPSTIITHHSPVFAHSCCCSPGHKSSPRFFCCSYHRRPNRCTSGSSWLSAIPDKMHSGKLKWFIKDAKPAHLQQKHMQVVCALAIQRSKLTMIFCKTALPDYPAWKRFLWVSLSGETKKRGLFCQVVFVFLLSTSELMLSFAKWCWYFPVHTFWWMLTNADEW